MSQTNPYAITDDTIFAADAPATERAIFLRKTYGLLTVGILVFAATLFACATIDPVTRMMAGLYRSWIVSLILLVGGAWLVHAVAEKPGINLIAFFAFDILFGLLVAPIVLILGAQHGMDLIAQAAILTAVVFIGLTAYVFYSGKDFSFLGGILSIGLFLAIGIALASWILGWYPGIWYSVLIVALFAGYVLWDTSNILRRYPTTMWVSAACVLLVDVIILFKHILILLAASRD
jgi:FtsH-binding integral membrane protein